jgi:hypothetical protein
MLMSVLCYFIQHPEATLQEFVPTTLPHSTARKRQGGE